MNKYIKKIAIVSLATIMAVIPVTVTRAEGTENDTEYVTINYDNTVQTNNNVIIWVEVTDDESGVDKLVYINNGTEENIVLVDEGGVKKGSFTAEENGDYRFRAYDIAGNETLTKVVITNIDKVLPELTLTPGTTNPTNTDIVITATATDNVGIATIILPDNTEIKENTAQYTVSQNGDYSFKAIDTAGNEVVESITISNINKEKPIITIGEYNKDWTNKDITVTATVDKGTLNQESYTFTENGSFTFVVTDEYGNISQETVTITNIDKTPPKLNITIIR